MSVNYALGLSAYEFKGKCGMKETVDSDILNYENILKLVDLLQKSKHAVVITGAGISTAAGIPDFRGPKGVWTLEEKGLMPEVSINFETAKPTVAHMALVTLEAHGFIKHLVSQNVDGLHLRSGFPRNRLSELHGNMFLEECDVCRGQFFGMKTVPTMGLKYTGNPCTRHKTWGKCRGKLKDTILDWEDELPLAELNRSEDQCRLADLCICLGTSLQIQPCGNMPLLTKKRGGKIVIVSLQPTRHDKHAHIKLNAYVDDVMKKVCEHLKLTIPEWTLPTFVQKSKHLEAIKNMRYIVVDEEYARSLDIPITTMHVPVADYNINNEFNDNKVISSKRIKKESLDENKHSENRSICMSDGILEETQFACDDLIHDEMDGKEFDGYKFDSVVLKAESFENNDTHFVKKLCNDIVNNTSIKTLHKKKSKASQKSKCGSKTKPYSRKIKTKHE